VGFDVSLHLIDPELVRGALLPALLAGAPPPPSPFDELEGARERWAAARAEVLEAPPRRAAAAACRLVVEWSAESLPFVWLRNFGLTCEPLRMERELTPAPDLGLGSPRPLFAPLVARRRGLARAFPAALTGDSPTGGYSERPQAPRSYYEQLPPALRARVVPVLAVVRAAQRHRLAIFEATDLLRTLTPPRAELLAWPGLARFGLEGAPLTDEEWRSVMEAASRFTSGDRHDLLDRAAELDPATRAPLLDELQRVFGFRADELAERRERLGLLSAASAPGLPLEAEHLVHAQLGVVRNRGVEVRTVAGAQHRFLAVEALASGRQLLVPLPLAPGGAPTAAALPLRALLPRDEAAALLASIEAGPDLGPFAALTWNRRHHALQAALTSGEAGEVAGALRCLAAMRRERELSFGDRALLAQARAVLAPELALALGLEPGALAQRIDAALGGGQHG